MKENLSKLRWKLAAVAAVLSFFLFLKSLTLIEFVTLTVAGAATGFLVGLVWERVEKKLYSLVLSFLIIGVGITLMVLLNLSAPASFPLYPVTGHCEADIPYTAQNEFTGECERFNYGGCGPRPHPWYYEEPCSPEAKQELCNEISGQGRIRVCPSNRTGQIS